MWYIYRNYTRFSTQFSELFDCIVCRAHYQKKLGDIILSKVPNTYMPFLALPQVHNSWVPCGCDLNFFLEKWASSLLINNKQS